MAQISPLIRSRFGPMIRSLAGAGDQTDLQRILALSPSALWWPANGSGWQGTSGGTLSASGQPLGLIPDLSQLGGKTQAEWLASAAELAPAVGSIAALSVDNSGSAVSSWSAPVWTIATPSSISGYPRLTLNIPNIVSGRTYYVSGTFATTGTFTSVQVRLATSGVDKNVGATATSAFEGVAVAGANATLNFLPAGTPSGTLTLLTLSVRELPGNHLRAGTWASPSDAARGTFQNNAINFDGVNDYYSLLNAISITTNMTAVSAFKRASAGIQNVMGGALAAEAPHIGRWQGDNFRSMALGGSAGAYVPASTATGSYVITGSRNVSTEGTRVNGVSIGNRAAPAASGAVEVIGRRNFAYNSGEISFLAVFPTKLTDANLALVEQIAASTNGATLA